MIYPPGSTSISVDIQWLDDTGAAVTGKVATDFPAVKWSSGTNTADTSITISDLAAITTAHPNDNTAGGVKEREGGVYRLDLPNNMFTSAGRKALTFAETTNKRLLVLGGNCFDVQYPQSDARFVGGQTASAAATVTFPALMASTTNITGGVITTVTTVTNQLTAAAIATGVWQDATSGDFTVSSSIGKSLYTSGAIPGATGGHVICGANAATTFATLTCTGALSINGTGMVSQTGDSYARLGAPVGASISADVAGVPAAALDLSNGVESSLTVRHFYRLVAAALLGKVSGGGTTTITFRDTGDSKNRIVATVDSNSNRTALTLDAT